MKTYLAVLKNHAEAAQRHEWRLQEKDEHIGVLQERVRQLEKAQRPGDSKEPLGRCEAALLA